MDRNNPFMFNKSTEYLLISKFMQVQSYLINSMVGSICSCYTEFVIILHIVQTNICVTWSLKLCDFSLSFTKFDTVDTCSVRLSIWCAFIVYLTRKKRVDGSTNVQRYSWPSLWRIGWNFLQGGFQGPRDRLLASLDFRRTKPNG